METPSRGGNWDAWHVKIKWWDSRKRCNKAPGAEMIRDSRWRQDVLSLLYPSIIFFFSFHYSVASYVMPLAPREEPVLVLEIRETQLKRSARTVSPANRQQPFSLSLSLFSPRGLCPPPPHPPFFLLRAFYFNQPLYFSISSRSFSLSPHRLEKERRRDDDKKPHIERERERVVRSGGGPLRRATVALNPQPPRQGHTPICREPKEVRSLFSICVAHIYDLSNFIYVYVGGLPFFFLLFLCIFTFCPLFIRQAGRRVL